MGEDSQGKDGNSLPWVAATNEGGHMSTVVTVPGLQGTEPGDWKSCTENSGMEGVRPAGRGPESQVLGSALPEFSVD